MQWGASNVYLFVLSSWKVNIAKNLIAVNSSDAIYLNLFSEKECMIAFSL